MQEEKRTGMKEEKELPRKPYEPPKMITYHLDDLWAAVGPVQACASFSGSVAGCLPGWDPLDPLAPPVPGQRP